MNPQTRFRDILTEPLTPHGALPGDIRSDHVSLNAWSAVASVLLKYLPYGQCEKCFMGRVSKSVLGSMQEIWANDVMVDRLKSYVVFDIDVANALIRRRPSIPWPWPWSLKAHGWPPADAIIPNSIMAQLTPHLSCDSNHLFCVGEANDAPPIVSVRGGISHLGKTTLLIDGNHRAVTWVRHGRDVMSYYLTPEEFAACVVCWPGDGCLTRHESFLRGLEYCRSRFDHDVRRCGGFNVSAAHRIMREFPEAVRDLAIARGVEAGGRRELIDPEATA